MIWSTSKSLESQNLCIKDINIQDGESWCHLIISHQPLKYLIIYICAFVSSESHLRKAQPVGIELSHELLAVEPAFARYPEQTLSMTFAGHHRQMPVYQLERGLINDQLRQKKDPRISFQKVQPSQWSLDKDILSMVQLTMSPRPRGPRDSQSTRHVRQSDPTMPGIR